MMSRRRNERCQRPKTHDLNFSFHFLSRANIGWKTFLRSLWKVLILCAFSISVVSEFSRRHDNHKLQRFDFLIERKVMMGLVNFIYHIIKVLHF